MLIPHGREESALKIVTSMDEILPVYKLTGFSSHDMVRIFKKQNDFKGKVGHAGSLDPFACGVVLLLLGDSTKKFDEIRKWPKTYLAGLRLGAVSTTGDPAGKIEIVSEASATLGQIEKALPKFVGKIQQRVPAYSAAKHKGQPLYKLARQGKTVDKAKQVEIISIETLIYKYPFLTLRIKCLGGTYIRQLAQDIGEELGIGAHLYYLEREAVGSFNRKDCLRFVAK